MSFLLHNYNFILHRVYRALPNIFWLIFFLSILFAFRQRKPREAKERKPKKSKEEKLSKKQQLKIKSKAYLSSGDDTSSADDGDGDDKPKAKKTPAVYVFISFRFKRNIFRRIRN